LNYTHEDLLGSEIEAQLFYREDFQRSFPFDIRPNALGDGIEIFSNQFKNEVWGARAQANTSVGENIEVTLGADYEAQDSGKTFFKKLSASAFDQGTIRATGEELINSPAFDWNKFGLFAQLQWDATEWLSLSGGFVMNSLTSKPIVLLPVPGILLREARLT